MTRRVCSFTLAAVALAGCGGGGAAKPVAGGAPVTIALHSPQLRDGGTLPAPLGCDGAGRSPVIGWSHLPAGTRELAITVDDPDAPGGDFVHWTLWHIGARVRGISYGAPPPGSRTTANSGGKQGYTPPCPPKGDKPHRYVFTVFALKRSIGAPDGADVASVRKEIAGAALARGTITVRFGR